MGNPGKRRRRENAKKKAAARKRSRPKAANARPDRFTVNYESPKALVEVGPLVKASWAIPESRERALVAAGRPVPTPVHGHLLVDTGAARTAIAQQVAEKDLGLHPTSIVQTFGAGGLHKNPSYFVRFSFAVGDQAGKRVYVNREFEVIGIPELDRHLGLVDDGDHPVRLIGLLGRDFLRHTTLTYNGVNGSIGFRLHLDSMRELSPES